MFKIRIRKDEVGLWFRHGDFKRVLPPGVHYRLFTWSPLFGHRVEVVSTLLVAFDHPKLDVMIDEPSLRDTTHVLELSDTQRALVWMDGRLGWILEPGRHVFWKEPYELTFETFDVTDFDFQHEKIDAIVNFRGASRLLQGIRVQEHERALLFREGEFVRELGPGLHVFWLGHGAISWKAIDLREQMADVSGQEIMTADKVTLRVNLVVTYRVTDARTVVTVVSDHAQALYREAQLALREAVGTRALDALLTDKDAVGQEIRDVIVERAAEFGVEVRSVGLRDIVLPGDMKSILNQVIEAQKQAEANLIRRREETAAARSQANTAKLVADNPVLARMKELEALQEILRGAKTTFVLGGGDLGNQLGRLVSTNGTNGDE